MSGKASSAGLRIWSLLATATVGLIALATRSTGWIFPLALGAVTTSLMAIRRSSKKPGLNPVPLVLAIAAVRFGFPALTVFHTEAVDQLAIVRVLGLQREDWLLGFAMAATGTTTVLLGWELGSLSRRSRRLTEGRHAFALPPLWLSTTAMALGLVALILFVTTNGIAFATAARTGEFRGVEIQAGTGVYFRMSLLLIAGSAAAVRTLLQHSTRLLISKLIAFSPALIASAALFVLGGRARAFVPIAIAAMMLWHTEQRGRASAVRGSSHGRHGPTYVAVGIIVAVFFAYMGISYRGSHAEGTGERASISGFRDYMSTTAAIDLGTLHSLAAATRLSPGVLRGQTFFANLSFPVSELLPIKGKSTGVFLVQGLLPESGRRWGFHATLFAESYLNFGLWALVVVLVTFGVLLQRLHQRFIDGRTDLLLYAVLVVHLFRVLFESVEKWPETVTVVTMTWLLLLAGRATRRFSVPAAKAPLQRSSWGAA